jgi:hypothetical protein
MKYPSAANVELRRKDTLGFMKRPVGWDRFGCVFEGNDGWNCKFEAWNGIELNGGRLRLPYRRLL